MDPDAPIDVPPTLQQDPGSDLLSTYWPTAVGLLLVAAGVVLSVRILRARRTRSRARRTLFGGAAVTGTAVVLVLSLALGVNTWVGYFPSVATLSRWIDDKTREPVAELPAAAVTAEGASNVPLTEGERVTTDTNGYSFLTAVPSTAAQVPATGAWVYLPPGYDAPGNTRRYPVMYALHGAPGSAADWFAGGRIDYLLDTLIASGSVPPMIVVSPDLNAGSARVDDEPLDRPGGAQLETFVTRDVVSWADGALRTVADKKHRVIAGMSAGGLGSLLYGLHSPETFSGVLSIMPYTAPYTASVVADPQAKKRNSPLDVIAATANDAVDRSQNFFLGQGDRESAAEATAIRDALRGQGRTTTLRVLPGLEHNWVAARTIAPYGLIWTAMHLGWNTEQTE